MLEEATFDRIDREYRFFFRHKSPFIDVYFERYLKRLVRLVLLDQEQFARPSSREGMTDRTIPVDSQRDTL